MPAEMPISVFVTGTDTGVGKTLVTAALARHFRLRGKKVGVMKPVETGVANPLELGADASLLQWAAEAEDPEDLISPYRFDLPVAPDQAASAAGQTIDVERIVTACQALGRDKDIVFIEGAGGLMVPIRGGFLMADLIRRLGAPLLLVTHPRLGTINHTLLTTFAARAMELEMCGFVVNRMPLAPDAAAGSAPHQLASLASVDLLGVLPELSGTDQEKVVQMAAEIEGLATYQWLLNGLGIRS